MDNETGKIIAIKKISNDQAYGIQSIIEIDLMSRIEHPNIISTDYVHCDISTVYIGMLFGKPLMSTKDYDAKIFTRDLVSAVVYLHRHGIYHCDIKPENIIIVDGRLVVIDFGVSTVKWSSSEYKQTLLYCAPEDIYDKVRMPQLFTKHLEIYKQVKDRVKSEYWSLGLCIIYLLARKIIFDRPYTIYRADLVNHVNKYLDDPRAFLKNLIAEEQWVNAIIKLMEPLASQRSIEEVISLVAPLIDGKYKNIQRTCIMDEASINNFNTISEWLFSTVSRMNMNKCSYIASLDIVARYFEWAYSDKEIRLIGVTALFMMQKIFELRPVTASIIWSMNECECSSKDILEFEQCIIRRLRNIVVPSDILKRIDIDKIIKYLSFKEYLTIVRS